MSVCCDTCLIVICCDACRREQFALKVQAGIWEQDTLDNQEPFEWWITYGGQVEELQTVATRLLSLVGSSSAAERNWSAYDFIHSKRRNRLGSDMAEKLVYVYQNMKLVRQREAMSRQLAEEAARVLDAFDLRMQDGESDNDVGSDSDSSGSSDSDSCDGDGDGGDGEDAPEPAQATAEPQHSPADSRERAKRRRAAKPSGSGLTAGSKAGDASAPSTGAASKRRKS